MHEPIISIITPSFNQARFLDQAIESVLSQEGGFYIDYILMDGRSTDESVDIIKEYESIIKTGSSQKKISEITYFYDIKYEKFNSCLGISFRWESEKDNGQAHAINKGIELAKGGIVAYLNSDDLYEGYAFKTIADFFQRNEQCETVYGNAFIIDDTGKKLGLYPTKDINADDIYSECFICQPSVFFRKTALVKYGLFNEKIHNSFDYEYWLRLYNKKAVFTHLDTVLASTRYYEETKTRKNRKEIYLEILALNKHYSGSFNNRWLYEFTREKFFLSSAMFLVVKLLNKASYAAIFAFAKISSFMYPYLFIRAIRKRTDEFFD